MTLLRHGEIMDGKEALPLLQKGRLLSSSHLAATDLLCVLHEGIAISQARFSHDQAPFARFVGVPASWLFQITRRAIVKLVKASFESILVMFFFGY
eukprot:COSAG04_NODE_1801_length_5550_cov_4.388369_5_plen_96_part_00